MRIYKLLKFTEVLTVQLITNKGQFLYAKPQAGIKLNFTKMMVGSSVIGTQDPATLTALINSKYR